ncbi:MAG: glycosyltransferase family 39 protein [Acidobacteria bacterium]|nr:glycosyltransferase family 39 protein [Acidobacteriota bacterium]
MNSFRWKNALQLDAEARKDVRIAVVFAAIAIAFYLPGINWGLPAGDRAGMIRPWGVDELGPMGPLAETYNVLTRAELGNPQYPMFHYFVIVTFYAPYLLYVLLTGGFVHPSGAYPFGFADPVTAIQTLTRIARGVSVLAGAGTVVLAYFVGKSLWDRMTGCVAATLVMASYSMSYYSRMSNTDVPAMFWMGVVLLLLVTTFREGLTRRRAVGLGIFAALAIATKDQNVGVLLFYVPAIVWAHLRQPAKEGAATLGARLAPLLVGGVVSGALYAVASGLLLWPAKFFSHLHFIRYGSMKLRSYFHYDLTLNGLAGLFQELGTYLVESTGWLALLAALIGMALCWRRERWKLLLLLEIPSLLLIVVLPVRYLAIRFLIPWVFLLACFAARGFVAGLRSERRVIRVAAAVALVAACAGLVARDADVVYLFWNDPRYAAAEWLQRNVPPGSRIECFINLNNHPAENLMPRLPRGVTLESIKSLPQARWVMTSDPNDFDYRFFAAPRIYNGMLDGSLGYEPVASFRTRSLFEHPSLELQINPRIRVFARREGRAPSGQAAESKDDGNRR